MASVELRPGDTLHIVWSSVQETPLGRTEVESSFAFSYDELLARLRAKGKMGKSKRSSTSGAHFSRVVALSSHALKKGRWSTGAPIDRTKVFNSMMERFKKLDSSEHKYITENAHKALSEIYGSKAILKPNQKQDLKAVLEILEPFASHAPQE
ncbi:MAG: hypothetical protein KA436_06395 [Oligoflexales bacterium]|nr:hypothetical protein [Oligoflexales bacterium]